MNVPSVKLSRQRSCKHVTTVASEIAGLRRVVCVECGHVSMEYRGDSVSPRSRSILAKVAAVRQDREQ
jgi:hypothetical protein